MCWTETTTNESKMWGWWGRGDLGLLSSAAVDGGVVSGRLWSMLSCVVGAGAGAKCTSVADCVDGSECTSVADCVARTVVGGTTCCIICSNRAILARVSASCRSTAAWFRRASSSLARCCCSCSSSWRCCCSCCSSCRCC